MLTLENNNNFALNAFQLKLLACAAMLADHTGILLVPHASAVHTVLRMVGRLAFPIFAYMLANGYRYSKNRKAYLLRLAVFALLIQIVYTLAMGPGLINIFATLTLGLLAIMGWEEGRRRLPGPGGTVSGALAIASLAAAAQLLNTDYGAYGVLLIASSHLLYGRLSVLALVWAGLGLLYSVLDFGGSIQLLAVCALMPLSFYDQQPGPRGFWYKWGFYLFYCLHLPLLYGLSLLLK